MKPGTPAHRDLFCRSFIETHVTFEPEQLPWPELDATYLERLRAFPFWSYARSLEHRAGRTVTAFAQTLDDPLVREAVALQAAEEARHGRLMDHVIDRYGIDAPVLAMADPAAGAEEFRVFGFGECTDSFIGFGAFAMVREKNVFPEAFLQIFDDVLAEEARHIVFFINWWRYEEARSGRDRFFQRLLGPMKYQLGAVLGAARGAGDGPTMPKLDNAQITSLIGGVSPVAFLETALAENRRHMARFDRRLIKPKLMPTLATLLLAGLRMIPPRSPTESQPSAEGSHNGRGRTTENAAGIGGS